MDIVAMIAMSNNCYIVKTSDYYCLDKSKRKVWKHRSKQHPYYLLYIILMVILKMKRLKGGSYTYEFF